MLEIDGRTALGKVEAGKNNQEILLVPFESSSGNRVLHQLDDFAQSSVAGATRYAKMSGAE